MNPDLIVGVTLPCMFGWFAWIIFSTFRRYKIARLQADVHSRLLEKIGSGQDLLAYAQTDAGRQLLESLQVDLFFFSRTWPTALNQSALLPGVFGTILRLGMGSWLMLREE
jgi:hypothetical protein